MGGGYPRRPRVLHLAGKLCQTLPRLLVFIFQPLLGKGQAFPSIRVGQFLPGAPHGFLEFLHPQFLFLRQTLHIHSIQSVCQRLQLL